MVKPLYPLRDKPPTLKKKKPEAAPQQPLWKNPYIISVAVITVVLAGAVVSHTMSGGKMDASSVTGSQKENSMLSFLKPSKYFSSKSKNLGEAQKEQLQKMGIDSTAESMGLKVETKNLREERRVLAMRKYEASRETADRRVKEKEEQRERLQSGTALQLKDAVMAAEDSGTLGIMKLERLLDEKLLTTGGDSADLDVLIFAYDRLAKAYENKNMEEKAKEAYLNEFKLLKSKAPDSQGPDWDNAISNIEQLTAKPSR